MNLLIFKKNKFQRELEPRGGLFALSNNTAGARSYDWGCHG